MPSKAQKAYCERALINFETMLDRRARTRHQTWRDIPEMVAKWQYFADHVGKAVHPTVDEAHLWVVKTIREFQDAEISLQKQEEAQARRRAKGSSYVRRRNPW